MFNKVILVGRLTRDPELRYTAGEGVAVVNFGIAVDRPFPNRQGERETDFLNVVVWRRQAENCANHLTKGRLVALDGRIQSRSFEDKEGNRRTFVEVVADNVKFLDWPKERRGLSEDSVFEDDNEGDDISAMSNGASRETGSSLDSTDDFDLEEEEVKIDDEDVPF